jgi:hypothetical protein
MARVLRFLLGLMLLPACCGFAMVLLDSILASSGASGWIGVESLSALGGIAAFALCWMALSHPVKTYVLGHELTHALWGLMFGARASNLRIGADGGSVRLSKTNLLITLAPYFFPFYTFIVVVAALVTYAFLRPLPFLPLWMFLVGFTWAFHILFTVETLSRRQPDITLYGRMFSWVFIFLANAAIIMVWLATTTPLTFRQLSGFVVHRVAASYVAVASGAGDLVGTLIDFKKGKQK